MMIVPCTLINTVECPSHAIDTAESAVNSGVAGSAAGKLGCQRRRFGNVKAFSVDAPTLEIMPEARAPDTIVLRCGDTFCSECENEQNLLIKFSLKGWKCKSQWNTYLIPSVHWLQ